MFSTDKEVSQISFKVTYPLEVTNKHYDTWLQMSEGSSGLPSLLFIR